MSISAFKYQASRLIDSMVNEAIKPDKHERARHRAAIVSYLLICGTAVFAFPFILLLHNVMSVQAAGLWSLALLFAGPAMLVSRTANRQASNVLAAFITATIILWSVFWLGQNGFLLALLLLILPLDSVRSGTIWQKVTTSCITIVALVAALTLSFIQVTPINMLSGDVSFTISLMVLVAHIMVSHGIRARTDSAIFDQQRRNLEDRYRRLAWSTSDVLTIHDTSGNVIEADEALADRAQMSHLFTKGRDYFNRVHVADRPAWLKIISDGASYAREQTLEFRLNTSAAPQSSEQEWRWMEIRVTPCDPFSDGDFNGKVLAATRDIDQRRKQQEDLRQAHAEVEAANAAISKFLASVSHELRTPLNAILGFSDLLRSESQIQIDESNRQEYINLIHNSGSYLLDLVNSILDVSKIEAGCFEVLPEETEVRRVIESTMEMMTPQVRGSAAKVEVDIHKAIEIAKVDPRALRQIIVNLMSNALKFSSAGDKITLSCKKEAKDLVLTVEDTGIGIPESEIGKLGRPFFQVDSGHNREHAGTGLGISLVKGLTELHDGTVIIRSVFGEGTSVEVRMPIDGPNESKDQTVVETGAFQQPHAMVEDLEKMRKSA